ASGSPRRSSATGTGCSGTGGRGPKAYRPDALRASAAPVALPPSAPAPPAGSLLRPPAPAGSWAAAGLSSPGSLLQKGRSSSSAIGRSPDPASAHDDDRPRPEGSGSDSTPVARSAPRSGDRAPEPPSGISSCATISVAYRVRPDASCQLRYSRRPSA